MTEEEKIKVKVTQEFRYSGETLEKGTVHDLPASVAESAIEKGYARKAEEEIPAIGEEPEGGEPEGGEPEGSAPSQIKKTDEGLDVSNYGAATFISADDVEEGDELIIKEAGWKDNRFDQEYLYLPVSVDGQEFRWRVNKTNAQILSEAFGYNTGKWVGKTVVVDKIREYPGVKKEGFIVRVPGDED